MDSKKRIFDSFEAQSVRHIGRVINPDPKIREHFDVVKGGVELDLSLVFLMANL